jgi:hypothetical protein
LDIVVVARGLEGTDPVMDSAGGAMAMETINSSVEESALNLHLPRSIMESSRVYGPGA